MNDKERIFTAASELPHPQQRKAFLDAACGQDAKLRREVEELLAHDDESSSFLEVPVIVAATDAFPPIAEGPGTVIGHYKLLQKIGEGGFGVVYMAEQQEPVRRKVAFKIIKPGMDTREVIARFESERQALALMDHPNIARVLDAGATESGRPYFVMELVKGVPITEYCDKNNLPPDRRLDLFITVCNAVQHAHQKGVIHRDIKPTNVMVTLHDGKPVPKVIDFGVAKATSQRLTERTLFTAYGQMVGTPAYMSPEQAEMSGLDIDTRSDIYSLGVLLYELLTGSTPFDGKRLREAGYAEMQRIIREEEPPRPSTRVSTLGEKLTVVSSHRSTDPKSLRQTLRGDLDLIVMKAMEKERSRRYDTPNAFADDILRYLGHEAILARPASAAYKVRKFVQRNRAAVATAATFAGLLLFGSTVSTWLAIRENKANRVAQVAKTEAEANLHQLKQQQELLIAAKGDAERAQQQEAEQRRLAQEREADAKAARLSEVAERETAVRERDKADGINQTLQGVLKDQRRTIYATEMNLVRLEAQRNNLPRMHELLKQHIPNPGEEDLRGFEWNYWFRFLHRANEVIRFDELAHGTAQGRIAMIPGGNLVAVSRSDKTQVVELPSGKVRFSAPTQLTWGVNRTPFAGDGHMVIGSAYSQGAAWPTGIPLLPRSFDVWDPQGTKRAFEIPAETLSHLSYLTISANGRFVAALGNDVTHRRDRPQCRLLVWSTQTGELLTNVVESRELNRLQFNADATQIAAYLCHGTQRSENELRDVIVVFDRESGKRLAVAHHDDDADSVFFLPGQNRLLVCTLGWSGRNRKELYRWTIGDEAPQRLGMEYVPDYLQGAVSPDGNLFAVSGHTVSAVPLIDTSTGMVVSTLHNEATTIDSLTFTPDGKQLIACGTSGVVLAWNLDHHEDLFKLRTKPLGSLAYFGYRLSPDHSLLAIATAQDGVRLRRRDGSETILRNDNWAASRGTVKLEFSPDSQLLAYESGVDNASDGSQGPKLSGKTLRLFDTKAGQERWNLRLPAFRLLASPSQLAGVPNYLPRQQWAFSPDGSQVVALRGDQVFLLDTANGQVRSSFAIAAKPYPVNPHLSKRTSTGQLLLAVLEAGDGGMGVLRLRDAQSGANLGETSVPSLLPITEVVAAPDGRHVGLVRGGVNRIEVWDLVGQRQVIDRSGHHVVFSGDGGRVAALETRPQSQAGVAGLTERVQQATLHEVASGQQLSTISLAGNGADEVRFSPDNRRLLTLHGKLALGSGGAVPEGRLWDVLSGREMMTIPVADVNHYIWDLDFDPQGTRLTSFVFVKSAGNGGGWGSAVYDAAPLSEAEDALLVARPLVAELFLQFPLVSEVVLAVQANERLRPAVREAALTLARQRTDDPQAILAACSQLVSRRDASAADYSRALRWAEVVKRLLPDDPRSTLLMGAAQFRTGRIDEALATLSPEVQVPPTIPAGNLRILTTVRSAFLMLAHLRAGSREYAESQAFLIMKELTADANLASVISSDSSFAVVDEAMLELRNAGGSPLGDPTSMQTVARNFIKLLDKNLDGQLSKEETPQWVQGQLFDLSDMDENDGVSEEELAEVMAAGPRFETDPAKRIEVLSKMIGKNPQQGSYYRRRGDAWRVLKEYGKALQDLDHAVRLDGKDSRAYLSRVNLRIEQGKFREALQDLEQALLVNPNSAELLNARAWMLATCPDHQIRDGKRAVEDATRSCELVQWKHSNSLDTLAAACAEVGDFAAALKWQEQAVATAHAANRANLESRLALYLEGKPYRDPPPAKPASNASPTSAETQK